MRYTEAYTCVTTTTAHGARDTPIAPQNSWAPSSALASPEGRALQRGAPASAGACCCRVRGGPCGMCVSPCGEGHCWLVQHACPWTWGCCKRRGPLCAHGFLLVGATRLGWQAHGIQAPSALLPRRSVVLMPSSCA